MAAAAVASSSSSPLCAMAPAALSSPGASLSAPPQEQKPVFALARLNGDVCLVQVPHTTPAPGAMAAALAAADVHVFRHEFITQFRFSHRATVHPADMHILERVADAATLYEADKGTVFLARDVVARLQKHARAGAGASYQQYYRHQQHPSRQYQYQHQHQHYDRRYQPAHAHSHSLGHPHATRITMVAARMPHA